MVAKRRVLEEVEVHSDELVAEGAVLGAVPERDQRQVLADGDLLGLLVLVCPGGRVGVGLALGQQLVELLVAVAAAVVTGVVRRLGAEQRVEEVPRGRVVSTPGRPEEAGSVGRGLGLQQRP